MMKRLSELKEGKINGPTILATSRSTFVPEIQTEMHPSNTGFPHLDTYDGSIDREDHLAYF